MKENLSLEQKLVLKISTNDVNSKVSIIVSYR